jgi:hypothetical protein
MSQWKDILEFARHHAPPIPCSSPSLNAQSWQMKSSGRKPARLEAWTVSSKPADARHSSCQIL